MILTKDKGLRMWGGGGSSSVGGGGGSSQSLLGFATQDWVTQNFLSIEFFSRLFQAHGPAATSGDPDVDVNPNDMDSTISSIEAMFGFWTEQYVSALGQGAGGGGGITLNEPLSSINTASLGAPSASNSVIAWNGSTWIYKIISDGTNMSDVWTALAASTNEQINISHLSTALNGYATTGDLATVQGYFDANGNAKKANALTNARTIWGQSFDGTANITGAMSDVTNIDTLLYFDGTNSRVGVLNSSPAYSLDVTGSFRASGTGTFAGLLTASGGITIPSGQSLTIGSAVITWDSTNSALRISTGMYSDSFVSALGAGSGGGGGSVSLNQPLSSINSASMGAPTTSGQSLVWNGSTWVYSDNVNVKVGSLSVSSTISAAGQISGATVSASGFYVSGKDDSYVLLAGGGTAALPDLANCLPLSGGTLTGILTISVGSVSGYQDALVIHDRNSGSSESGRIRFTSASYTTGITLGANSGKTGLLVNDIDTVWTSGNLTKVSQLSNDSGYTTNIGTVTQVKVGTTSYNPLNGVVSLPAYPTQMDWANITNKPKVALQESWNNLIHSGNEFTFAPSGFTGGVYVGYRTVGGLNGSYSYSFYNGAGSFATVKASYFTTDTTTLCTNLNADLLDGHHDGDITAKYLNTITNNFNLSISKSLYFLSCHSTEATGAPSAYTSGISIMTDYVGFQLMTYGGGGDYLFFRRVKDNGTWQDWKYIAFTDSNVSSATKLQTARTIWGQSFDGSANVTGALTNTGSITPSATTTYNIGSSSLFYSNVYSSKVLLTSASFITTEGAYLALGTASNEMIIGAGSSALFINYRRMTGKTTVTEFRWYAGGGSSGGYSKFVLGDLESYGNVGIGVSQPSYKLHVNGYTFTTRLYLASGVYFEKDSTGVHLVGAGFYSDSFISALGAGSGGGSSITLNQPLSGINSASMGAPSSAGQTVVWNGSSWVYSSTTWLNVSTLTSGGATFGGNISVAGTLNATGSFVSSTGRMALGYSTVSSSYRIRVSGNAYFDDKICFYGGSQVYGGTGSGNTSILNFSASYVFLNGSSIHASDMNMKTIQGYIDNVTTEQVAMSPIFDYTWKTLPDYHVHSGTSAQYWQSILPHCVEKNPEGNLGLDYEVVALVSAVVTARKVVEHERRIQELERENERLRNEIETLKAA